MLGVASKAQKCKERSDRLRKWVQMINLNFALIEKCSEFGKMILHV